jgi:hypothetical protein
VGRHLIPYLNEKRYFGIEPNTWLVEAGLKHEIPAHIVEQKHPAFKDEQGFHASVFRPLKFDFIFVHAVLTHAAHHQIDTLMQSLPAALKKTGILIGDVAVSLEDYQGDSWRYPGQIGHREACVRRVAESLGYGFEWIPDALVSPLPRRWFTIRKQS